MKTAILAPGAPPTPPPNVPTRTVRPSRQRGAALLTAMVIVTVVASLSAAMVWQQWRAVQVETAERARTQSFWLLAGSRDWARLILGEDGKGSTIDHLGEPWATPLAEARLSTFLAADKKNPTADGTEDVEAFLSGSMIDLQSRYNLRNLIGDKGLPEDVEVKTLTRLCDLVKAPNGTAEAIIQGMQRSRGQAGTAAPAIGRAASATAGTPTASAAGATAAKVNPTDALIAPLTIDDLTWFGLTTNTVTQLRPFVTLLPQRTAVNLNTASREVMVAVVEGLDQGLAQRIIQARQQKPFDNLENVRAIAPNLAATALSDKRVDVKTSYFEITGRLRLDNQIIEERALVRRVGRNTAGVKTWHSQRLSTVLGDTDVR